MDIRSLHSVTASAPATTSAQATGTEDSVRPIVTAVREVNKAELLGEGRELAFRRDPETRQRVIQIVDKDTGDVIDQLPPESVLRLAQQLK